MGIPVAEKKKPADAVAERTPKAELQNKLEAIKTFKPESKETIPDIGLYMDQVISFMERQHPGFAVSDEALTPSMVNNYVKKNVIPRADGKKYSREHVYLLTLVCLLKQVVSVDDCAVLLRAMEEQGTTAELYEEFSGALEKALPEAAERPNLEGSRGEMAKAAMSLAISSYAEMLACRVLTEYLRKTEPEEK